MELGEEVPRHETAADDKVAIPRRLKITRKMLNDHGLSKDCAQCEHIRAFDEHKPGLGHSEK